MARKTLADFNYDYQAYADYLESAECMQDDGIDTEENREAVENFMRLFNKESGID